jgi:streptomycin 6-kinase
MTRVEIPPKMQAFAGRSDTWAEWIHRLPLLAADLVEEWGLRVDGPSRHGEAALVVPVRTAEDRAAMLKLGWPHEEAEQEHLALRFWGGRGAVALLRADPHRSALLLERLHIGDLTPLPINAACEVVAGLYADLHIPASPEFRTLSSLCRRWTPRLEAIRTHPGLPRRYVERAVALTRELGSDPATDGTLVHTDFHFENVLAAERQPWLAIDPKPLSGDPAFEIAPLLWNRWDEALDTGDLRRAIRDRFETVVDVAGLDEERAKAWVVVRMLVNAMWEVEDPSPDSDEKGTWLTDAITIAKSMDD